MLLTKIAILAAAMATASLASRCELNLNVPHPLPSTGLGAGGDLPGPESNVTLRFITIGHGIQNYTCANSTAKPKSIGALAVLYDVSHFFPGTPETGLPVEAFNKLSTLVLRQTPIPLNLVNPAAAAVPTEPSPFREKDYQAVKENAFPAVIPDLNIPNFISARFLGVHLFDAQSVPIFDLDKTETKGGFFSGAKTATVKAPPDADVGLIGTGAVDWLKLNDKDGKSRAVTEVYRVVTAGGGPQACAMSGVNEPGQALSVPYAAQYWFFGPA